MDQFSQQPLADVESRFRKEGTIEPAVWDVVIAANALGLPTRACCEGHSRYGEPYVAFGIDYGEHSPEDPVVAETRTGNRLAKERLLVLVAAFHTLQSAPSPAVVRLRLEDGASEEEARRLRERFARQRRRLEHTDPSRIATDFNYRQYEDTFVLRAGQNGWLAQLWTPWRRRLLARRQNEMRAFGRFLRLFSTNTPVSVLTPTARAASGVHGE